MRLSRKVVLLAGAALMASLLGALFVVWRSRKKVRRFQYLRQELSAHDFDALARKPSWQARSLEVEPGVALRGLARVPARPDAPWVLFFSGNSATSLEDAQKFLISLCTPDDWGALVFAYRGYDGNPGRPTPDALADDAWAAFRSLVEREHVEPRRIHVAAFSLGTSLAAGVAAHDSTQSPATLTLLAPTTELDMGNRTDIFLHRYETLKYLSAIKCPTLVVHGTLDGTLPVEGGREIAQTIVPPAKFVEMKELGHFDLEGAPAVQDTVRSFIKEHASGSAR